MRCTADQLTKRGQLFGLHELRLQELQFLKRLLRSAQQPYQFNVEKMLLQEYKRSHDEHGAERQNQSECADPRWHRAAKAKQLLRDGGQRSRRVEPQKKSGNRTGPIKQ